MFVSDGCESPPMAWELWTHSSSGFSIRLTRHEQPRPSPVDRRARLATGRVRSVILFSPWIDPNQKRACLGSKIVHPGGWGCQKSGQ